LSESPIPELPDDADPAVQARAVRWAATVIAVAALFLLVFNATAIRSWAASLKPSEASAQFAVLAGQWEDATARFGLTQPRAVVHDLWAKQRALTWNGSPRVGADDPPP
jgi:hypothetical protein